MFWLWLIVAILLIAIGSYRVGTIDWDVDQKIGVFWTIFFGALLWPLVLVVVIIIGPFYGLFWLGERKRQKLKEAAKDK